MIDCSGLLVIYTAKKYIKNQTEFREHFYYYYHTEYEYDRIKLTVIMTNSNADHCFSLSVQKFTNHAWEHSTFCIFFSTKVQI